MSPKTRRVARTALLIAAAGVVPLMGAASAHAADNPLGGLGGLNGLTAPDPSTVTDQLPGATNAVGHSAESAGKTVDHALPAATQATQAAPAGQPAAAPAAGTPVEAPAHVQSPIGAPAAATSALGGLGGLGGL